MVGTTFKQEIPVLLMTNPDLKIQSSWKSPYP